MADIGGLMDFYDPSQGRDNIYALKKTYDEAIGLGLSKRQLHMKMKGATTNYCSEKKRSIKIYSRVFVVQISLHPKLVDEGFLGTL